MTGPTPRLPRVDVLGVPVTAATVDEALHEVESWVSEHRSAFATFTGVHGVREAQSNTRVMEAHRRADLVACDGMPMVWACRWAGVRDAERVYGPDFMLALCERARAAGWRSFFYGGKPGVPELLVTRLVERFPGLPVAGTYSPPFRLLTPEEDAEVVARINDARPDLVWVGLSTPKQELWMLDHVTRIEGATLLGVGAAFDFHAGLVRQAPRWMQRSGLEWLFRLATEPRRLAGRYLRNNPRFVCAIVRHPPRVAG